jgi:hypothetical protein
MSLVVEFLKRCLNIFFTYTFQKFSFVVNCHPQITATISSELGSFLNARRVCNHLTASSAKGPSLELCVISYLVVEGSILISHTRVERIVRFWWLQCFALLMNVFLPFWTILAWCYHAVSLHKKQ